MEIRAFSSVGKISHQLHSDLTPTSTHFRTFIPQGGNGSPDKGGSDYVFRYGMVLVAFDCCGAGDLHPVQGKVYEMVEQTGTGEEKELPVSGIFIAVGMNPQTDAVVSVLDLDHGYVRAGEDGVTEQPGLFVAGDVRTTPLRQGITAAADGANGLSSAEKYIMEL